MRWGTYRLRGVLMALHESSAQRAEPLARPAGPRTCLSVGQTAGRRRHRSRCFSTGGLYCRRSTINRFYTEIRRFDDLP